MRGRGLIFLLLAAFVFLFGAIPAAAEDGLPDFGEPLDEFYAAIPDDLWESFPDGLFSGEIPDAGAMQEAWSFSSLLDRVREALTGALPEMGRLFGQLCLCALFAALFEAICSAFDGGRLSGLAQLCGRLCMAGLLLDAQLGQLTSITACLRQLRLVVNAMLPVIGAIFAAGGSTGTATAGCGSLLLFLNLGENLCAALFLPLIAADCGLSAVAWLPDGGRLKGLLGCLKRVITWSLGLFGTVFSAVFAFQTILAAGADSVAARTVKFTVSSAVPVIGGVVGDTVRTVAGGLGYLKDTVGLLGIFLLVLIVLPPLVQLLLYRAALALAGAVAELLGCEKEGRLLGDFGDANGMLLALLCGAMLCFLFALVMFVRISLAMGK